MSTESPFDVLNVEKGASDDVVEQAYRELVLRKHPDVGGDTDEFVRIKAAYESIINNETESFTSEQTTNNTAYSRTQTWNRATRNARETRSTTHQTVSENAIVRFIDYEALQASVSDEQIEQLLNNPLVLWEVVTAITKRETSNKTVCGEFRVDSNQTMLEAAEQNGFTWPFSCRGGACANCAVRVLHGDMTTEPFHILPPELVNDEYRLSCLGQPTENVLYVLCNVAGNDENDELDELLLPGRE